MVSLTHYGRTTMSNKPNDQLKVLQEAYYLASFNWKTTSDIYYAALRAYLKALDEAKSQDLHGV